MREKIEKALSTIILFYPSLGYIIYKWDIRESTDIPTMATNYKELLYNPEFVSTLTDSQVAGVVLHEIFHCVFLHPTEITRIQSKGKNLELWTIAEEIVVNAAVKDLSNNSITLPGEPMSPFRTGIPSGPSYWYDPMGHTHTAEEIYQELVKKLPELPKTSANLLVNDVMPEEQKTEQLEATETAIAVLEDLRKRRKGQLPGGLNRLFKKIKESRIPWDRILQNFVGSIVSGMDDVSWSRLETRRNHEEVLQPGLVENSVEDIIVAIDTSGSISQEQLATFASGVAKLLQYTQEVTVITTDAKVHEKVKVSSIGDLLKNIKFKGAGGTDFTEVFQQIKKCNCLIFFTDGYATYPNKAPKYPVLWILTKEGSKPPFGKVAYMLDV
ncbi:MAG: VWA-like domain-containing protein [Dictyoglomus turgidum]